MSVSGGYKGFSASLSVDVSTFKESMTKGTSFGENKVVFNLGGADMPEPIGLKLFRISRAFDATFFGDLDQQYKCNNLEQRKSNILQLFTKYPGLKNATTPQGIISIIKNTRKLDNIILFIRGHFFILFTTQTISDYLQC